MITVRLEGIKEALAQFDPKIVKQATRASIGRAINSGKALVSDEVTKVWNVKRSDFVNRIIITPPRMDDLKGVITISGRGMSLSYFGAKQFVVNKVIIRGKQGLQTKTLKRAAKFQGVEVEVRKEQKTQLRSAFMATMQNGHVGVMRRTSKKAMKSRANMKGPLHKQAIVEKGVVSVASMVNQAEVMANVTKRIEERWSKEFPHQLEYYQQRADK